MKTKKLNISILNNNLEASGKLRRYLKRRFGNTLNISLYRESQNCINMMHGQVHLVAIDDYLYEWGTKEAHGTELLGMIREKSPETVVVILRSNVDVGESIEAMQLEDNVAILNKISVWQHLQNIIDQTVGQPIKYLVAEFGVKKFMKVFFFTFSTVILTGLITLTYMM